MATELATTERVVHVIAHCAIDNERYFSDLDSVVGDGDFGYSLARGFEKVIEDWESFDRTDPGTFLQKVAMTISSRIGGTSGPIWGTAFLRAATVAKKAPALDGDTVVAMLRAAAEGIMARGNAGLGDKTLLDALCPMTDTIAELVAERAPAAEVADAAARRARDAAEATSQLEARRGRASYSGERSIGSVDPGAMAVAVMAEKIAAEWE